MKIVEVPKAVEEEQTNEKIDEKDRRNKQSTGEVGRQAQDHEAARSELPPRWNEMEQKIGFKKGKQTKNDRGKTKKMVIDAMDDLEDASNAVEKLD